MKASVPTPNSGAGCSTPNGRIFGLRKSTLSLITALTVGTPLLVACDNADAIPVNTEVTSTPAATTTEQTPAPTTSENPVAESTTSKAPTPEKTTTSQSASSSTESEPTEPSQQPTPSEPAEEVSEAFLKALKSAEFYASIHEDYGDQNFYDYLLASGYSFEATEYAIKKIDIDWHSRAASRMEDYVEEGGRSYSTTFDDLTKRAGFSEEVAQLVLNESNIDWKSEALESAQERIDSTNGISKSYLFTWLTSTYALNYVTGDSGFTDEEALYASENVNADWNQEALEALEIEISGYSPVSKKTIEGLFGQQLAMVGFTQSEFQYAVDNLPKDTWKQQAVRAATTYKLGNSATRNSLITHLVDDEWFTQQEAEYAADQVGL